MIFKSEFFDNLVAALFGRPPGYYRTDSSLTPPPTAKEDNEPSQHGQELAKVSEPNVYSFDIYDSLHPSSRDESFVLKANGNVQNNSGSRVLVTTWGVGQSQTPTSKEATQSESVADSTTNADQGEKKGNEEKVQEVVPSELQGVLQAAELSKKYNCTLVVPPDVHVKLQAVSMEYQGLVDSEHVLVFPGDGLSNHAIIQCR